MDNEVLIKAAHGGRINVAAGQILEIENVDGTQICDFWAFSVDNVREFLSPAHCRSKLSRTTLLVGDQLVSVLRRPMLEIVADTCGQNDFLAAPCDPMRYYLDFALQQHRSCRVNLAEIMAPEGIPMSTFRIRSISFKTRLLAQMVLSSSADRRQNLGIRLSCAH